MDASPMAKGYYKLPDNAKWVDTLKCMVSHTTVFPMMITQNQVIVSNRILISFLDGR